MLVGPSGCGKSTLLRMIAGLEQITGGEIAIGGTRRQQSAAQGARHRHGVPELRALPAHDRARQHGVQPEAAQSRCRRPSTPASSRRPRSWASAHILDRYPRQLSGGQRQRVAMGRAIVRDPQVFLFDEPLSNLDAKLRVQMRTEIKALHQRLRTTSVYVTHDQVEAMTMADRIVVMHDGRVEQIGTPLDLYDNPVNLFVAGFIGSPAMNFIKGTLRRDGGRGLGRGSGRRDAAGAGKPRRPRRASRRLRRAARASRHGRQWRRAACLRWCRWSSRPAPTPSSMPTDRRRRRSAPYSSSATIFAPAQAIQLQPQLDVVHLFDAESGRKLD